MNKESVIIVLLVALIIINLQSLNTIHNKIDMQSKELAKVINDRKPKTIGQLQREIGVYK